MDRIRGKLGISLNHEIDDPGLSAGLTMITRDFPVGVDIIREGDPLGPVLVILEGWACRYKTLPNGGRQIVAFLIPGDACNIHVNLRAESDHSVATLTPVSCGLLDTRQLEVAMVNNPMVSKAIRTAQLAEECTMRAWLASVGRRNGEGRIAHLMCELYLRGKAIGIVGANHFATPLTQSLVADAVGLTPVHVNRTLARLRKAGIIALDQGRLTVFRPRELAQLLDLTLHICMLDIRG